jgi:putative oxidoreductase
LHLEVLRVDTALLLLRLVLGAYLFGHGAQKAFGWFGGAGFTTTLGHVGGAMRHRPAWLWGVSLVLGETVGGALTLLGLYSPLGPLAIAATMLGATAQHWPRGPWGQRGGYELPLTNLVVAVALALTGPGSYSLDAVLGIHLSEEVSAIAAVLLIGGAIVALLTRRRPAPMPAATATSAQA